MSASNYGYYKCSNMMKERRCNNDDMHKPYVRAKRNRVLEDAFDWGNGRASFRRSWKDSSKDRFQWERRYNLKKIYKHDSHHNSYMETFGGFRGSVTYRGYSVYTEYTFSWSDFNLHIHRTGCAFPLVTIPRHEHGKFYTPKGMHWGQYVTINFVNIEKLIDKLFPLPF